jgi:hypothetical protein
MAHKEWIFGLCMIVATSPVSAAKPEPTPTTVGPEASPDARYCLRIEAVTGTRLEKVRCWTRQEWAEQDVDVDKEWAQEGVAVIG